MGSAKEICVEELVPRIGQARKAPMAAIGAGVFATVGGGVGVLPVLRQSGDVEENHGFLDPAQNLVDHHPGHWRPRRIPRPEVGLCFAGAGLRGLAPVPATEIEHLRSITGFDCGY